MSNDGMSDDVTPTAPGAVPPPAAPGSRTRRFAAVLLPALPGAAIGYGGILAGSRLARSNGFDHSLDALGGVDLLLLPLTFFVVILIHELGHLAGGMARGMRFLLLIVGPLRLRRTVSGLKLDWFFSAQTMGGLAAAMPDPQRPIRGQLLPLIVGGPAASLLLALSAFGLSTLSDGRISAHLLILALLSALIFVATALPMRAGGFLSDGRQCIEVLRGGPAVEQRAMLMAAYAESLSGVRPRDRDPAPLARALELSGDEPLRDVAAALMAYQVALDRRDVAAAGAWIDRVAAGHDAYPGGFRQGLANEIAFFSVRYRDDVATARAWHARAKGGVVEPASRALTEAALAYADGDAQAALDAIARAERGLRACSDAGSIPLLQDELSSLRRDAEAGRARPVAA
jgi:hypothetical protein